MANNPFIGSTNPPDTIFGGISQSGALGGQLSSRRVEPLISPRGGEIARVTFGNGLVYDPFNVWTEVGNLQNGGILTGSGVRESILPTATAYEKASAGPFHFPGDFSIAFVYVQPATTASSGFLYQDGSVNSAGYTIRFLSGSTTIQLVQSGAGVNAAVGGTAIPAGTISVVCAGAAGSLIYCKTNLGTLNSAVGTTYVPALAFPTVSIGAASGGTTPFPADIYEMWASTQTPSDALFISIMNEVKTKLGITAW